MDYRELIVWQKAMNLVTEIYKVTNSALLEKISEIAKMLNGLKKSISAKEA